VEDRKIASIGVRVSGGVATHGFALNVDNDLAPFGWVVPCGLPDVAMTSIARETGRTGRLPCVRREVAFRVAEALGQRQRLMSHARLQAALAAAPVPA
jgi:lipoyl(octanoyl) transferase